MNKKLRTLYNSIVETIEWDGTIKFSLNGYWGKLGETEKDDDGVMATPYLLDDWDDGWEWERSSKTKLASVRTSIEKFIKLHIINKIKRDLQ